jgi:PadR family transcriptional regulator PadR
LIEVSESALYPVLRRLESQGLLETYSMEYSGRLRRYYRITSDEELKGCMIRSKN